MKLNTLKKNLFAFLFLCSATLCVQPASATDKTPGFIKVGSTYSAHMQVVDYQFTVIELGDGPWVKARVKALYDSGDKKDFGIQWFNTLSIVIIREISEN